MKINWGNILTNTIQSGLEVGASYLAGERQRKEQEEQEQQLQVQQNIADEEARRQFDEMMKYRYAALAQQGAGGGTDPRLLALKQAELKLQQKQLAEEVKYNQAVLAAREKEALQEGFFRKLQTQGEAERVRSQGFRDLLSAYQTAYGNR